MCGINGFNWKDEEKVGEMNVITRNRGPDDAGVYSDDRVSLGHTRLAIIDLSEKGHQPMPNEDGTVWITFNGEIYNFHELREELVKKGHVFRSDTDTEVIIHAYEEEGIDCVKRFNGMWAFCLYDRNRGRLILSRDRFGIKPLYYFIDGSRIVFSSMIGGILCHDVGTSPNERAIMEYLAFNLEGHGTETFYTNIRSLERGGVLVYGLRERACEIVRPMPPVSGSKGKGLKESLRECIRLRTMADVPIGSCLSGGIDSSAIVCTLDELLDEDFYTFSFVAPGKAMDESKYIEEVGKHTKTRQFFTRIDPATFLAEYEDFIAAQEEPVTGLGIYAQYRVMKLAHESGAKVLLDGQGADELFAGYPYYYGYYFYELLSRARIGTLIREMYLYSRVHGNCLPHGMLAFMLLPGFVKKSVFKMIISPWVDADRLKRNGGATLDPRWNRMGLDEALRMTLFETSIPELLLWEDKNSMRWSVETRPPFLDDGLVDLVFSLPSARKLRDGRRKVAFKEAIKDVLPEMILKREDKIGFETPTDDFFRDPGIRKFCDDIIYSDSFKSRPYWKWPRVERLYQKHLRGEKNAGNAIWKWVNLELWLRQQSG